MMINTAINRLDQQYIPGTERVGKTFFSGKGTGAFGTDILEISAEARERLAEKNASPLARAVSRMAAGIRSEIELSENIYDSDRTAIVNNVKKSIANGTYDFDAIACSSKLADIVAERL